MTDQLEFIQKVREYQGKEEVVMVALSELPPNKKLLRGRINRDTMTSIQLSGQKYPIILAKDEKGKILIVDGEQRIKIARKLGKKFIPAIWLEMSEFEATIYRAQLNNARQENIVADIVAIREILEQYPTMNNAGVAKLTSMPQGRIRSLRKMAILPRVLLEGVSEGTISPNTLAEIAKQPRTTILKLENKYHKERTEWQTKEEDVGRSWIRLSDQKEFASTPSLITADDVKEVQRIRVENNVQSLPMNLGISVTTAVEGFAAVKDNQFITPLMESADAVRLEIGRKVATIVKVRSI
jgi:hypothetical protein